MENYNKSNLEAVAAWAEKLIDLVLNTEGFSPASYHNVWELYTIAFSPDTRTPKDLLNDTVFVDAIAERLFFYCQKLSQDIQNKKSGK